MFPRLVAGASLACLTVPLCAAKAADVTVSDACLRRPWRRTTIRAMATSNGGTLSKPRRRLVFALGARSAFDISGLGMLRAGLFDAGDDSWADPSDAVARDMARVMHTFRRSVQCGARALADGTSIDELEPGCSETDDQDVITGWRPVMSGSRSSS